MAHVLAFDGGIGARSEIVDGVYTGRPDGPFTYREGKAEAIRELAAARGHRPRRVLRLQRLGVRPADAARASATRSRSTPTRRSRSVAREEGWDVMRLERLGRRLKVVGVVRRDGRARRRRARARRAECGSSATAPAGPGADAVHARAAGAAAGASRWTTASRSPATRSTRTRARASGPPVVVVFLDLVPDPGGVRRRASLLDRARPRRPRPARAPVRARRGRRRRRRLRRPRARAASARRAAARRGSRSSSGAYLDLVRAATARIPPPDLRVCDLRRRSTCEWPLTIATFAGK